MIDRLGAWPLRALWFVLPVTAGPAFAGALDGTAAPFRDATTAALWAIWAATLLATLLPLPVTLTAVRVVVPAAPFAVAWALATIEITTLDVVGIAVATLAAAVSLLAGTGDAFVDGASYGSERRFALRPPAALVVGPIEIAWAVAVAGAVTGPLLLAAERWTAGVPALLVGWALAAVAVRALHGLSRRWLVFVPAGLVVHDPLTLQDPVLVPSRSITRIGPTPVASASPVPGDPAPSFGILLAAGLDPPLTVSVRGEATTELHELDRILIAASRPGAVLAAAADRRLPVG